MKLEQSRPMKVLPRRAVFPGTRAARDGQYKYVRYLVEGETEELYDLRNDPEELVNLAAKPEHAARLAALRQKAIDELRRTDAPFVDRLRHPER